MAEGPGKYDDICSMARLMADASTTVLVIVDGNKGDGFSVQCEDPFVLKNLPRILRLLANDIDKEMA